MSDPSAAFYNQILSTVMDKLTNLPPDAIQKVPSNDSDEFDEYMLTQGPDVAPYESPLEPQQLKIVMAGAPCAGKGTQCDTIKKKFGVIHLSTDDMLRANVADKTELGLAAETFMHSGQLVPDSLIIDIIRDRLRQRDCVENGNVRCIVILIPSNFSY